MSKSSIYLVFCSILILCASCGGNQADEIQEIDFSSQVLSFEENEIREHIVLRLKLMPEDIGSFEMVRAHLNADGEEDGVVYLNLAPKAKRDMETSSNPARFQDAGYIGDYNFLFVWDGASQTLGAPFKLVGNGLVPLRVSLINLLDFGYKNITARYRVQNSVFETYFMNRGGSLIPIFSFLIVDQIGTDGMQPYVHQLEVNPGQLEKDIVIYEGAWTDYDKDAAAYAKNEYPIGKIENTGKEIYRFFFDPRSGKYATFSTPPSTEND
jgi:hypothetical protein